MASLSTSLAHTKLEQLQVLNEVLDDETVSDYSLDDDSVFDNDYTQLVNPGNHVTSDSESDSAER
jgi:hypothetical protein